MSREEEIFSRALVLGGLERASFLDRVCGGDDTLRRRIEELLAAHAASERFLSDSPPGLGGLVPEEKPGSKIGHYTVLKKLGEGGCGVVYLAEQAEPVRRNVAVKVIKLGMDTREVITRFQAERQALALMDHPDIARVFEAGSTATGRPFFAMEFVAGVPITKFCDANSLTMAARLELFARVCLAVQHAHQKGVIHRDIKPSNILVHLQDGVPTPKVIDFGIAKATEGRLTDVTLATALDQMLGTPAYMSPEQADARGIDIDTRSDVYSLGVLLYELLTGRPPFDPQSLGHAAADEIRRIIREVDPPRPSTVVQTLSGADRVKVARQRRAGLGRLASVLRGDLDWIVMRCLDKDRSRRYGTAQAVAEDVRRHLRSEPVTARPPQRRYQILKFIRRHRVACAAGLLVTFSLVGGLGVSTWSYLREREARADALRQRQQAEDLLTFMLGDFRTELKKMGRLSLLDAVGEKSMAYFAALDSRDLTDVALTRQAQALTQIGEIRVDEGRLPDAARAFTMAYDRAATLAARHPANGEMLFERAQAEYWRGLVARRRHDNAGAAEWFIHYRDSGHALVALDDKNPRWQKELAYGQHALATVALDRRAYAEARDGFLAQLATVQRRTEQNPSDGDLKFSMADALSWLGTVAEITGDLATAKARFTAQTAALRELIHEEPEVMKWRYNLADSLVWENRLLAATGDSAVARLRLDEAAALLEPMIAGDPANQRWRSMWLNVRGEQAWLALALRQPGEAAVFAADIRSQLEKLGAVEATTQFFPARLASLWCLEAELRLAAGRADALDAALRALSLCDPLLKAAESDDRTIGQVLATHVICGRACAALGRADDATGHWRQALEIAATLRPSSLDWHLLDPVARALSFLGRDGEARDLQARLARLGYVPLFPWPGPVQQPPNK